MAVLDVDHLGPAAARVEAEHQLARRAAERVLELVSIAPRSTAGSIGSSSKPSRPPMRRSASSTCPAFSVSWRSYGKSLPGRAGARLAAVEAAIGHAVGAGIDQLDGPRLGEGPLRLRRAEPGPGRREGRRRRRRRSRRRAPPRARRGRATRSRARAPRRGAARGVALSPASATRLSLQPLDLRPRSSTGSGRRRFCEELSREHYLHLAGQKPRARDRADLRGVRGPVQRATRSDRLRELVADAPDGDERRRLRYLLHFSLDGLGRSRHVAGVRGAGRARGLARGRPGDGPVPYRAVQVEQANEPDAGAPGSARGGAGRPARRAPQPASPCRARARATRSARASGWPSYAAAYAELRGIDLEALARQAARFLDATEDAYPRGRSSPSSAGRGGALWQTFGACDLPRFFRAADLDSLFAADRLVASFRSTTLAALGVDLERQPNIHLDAEPRPTKSPRAFCSTPRVPDEIYLVISPPWRAGRLRRAVSRGRPCRALRPHRPGSRLRVPASGRQLGDRVVRVPDRAPGRGPRWLRARLGVEDPESAVAHARAVKLVMLRRYSAKLAYELELHGGSAALAEMPGRYAALLGRGGRDSLAARELADRRGRGLLRCLLPARLGAGGAMAPAALRERFGEAWFAAPAVRASGCGSYGAGASGSTPTSCSPRARRGARLRGPRRASMRRLGEPHRRSEARRLLEPPLDLGEHALSRLAALLAGAHLAQLGRAQVPQPRLDLGGGELVVGRDRAAGRDPGAPPESVGLGERRVGGVARRPRGALGGRLAWRPCGGGAGSTSCRAWSSSSLELLDQVVAVGAAAGDEVADQLVGVACGSCARA